jgi:hypothetical protein
MVENFVHVDLKQTLLLTHMLKIKKNRKCYGHTICIKAENKEKRKEKIEPKLKASLLFFFFLLHFSSSDG